MQEETKGQASSDVWLHSGCVSKRRGCSCASGQLPADVGWRAMLPGRAHHLRHRAVCGSSLCWAARRPPNGLRSVLAAPSFDARERSGRGPGICSSARLVAHTVPGRWRLRERKQPSPAPAAYRQMDFAILLYLLAGLPSPCSLRLRTLFADDASPCRLASRDCHGLKRVLQTSHCTSWAHGAVELPQDRRNAGAGISPHDGWLSRLLVPGPHISYLRFHRSLKDRANCQSRRLSWRTIIAFQGDASILGLCKQTQRPCP